MMWKLIEDEDQINGLQIGDRLLYQEESADHNDTNVKKIIYQISEIWTKVIFYESFYETKHAFKINQHINKSELLSGKWSCETLI